MSLKLYNTLTRKKEIFKPRNKNYVGFYSCGPTVYNYVHLGNHRTNILNDLLKRSLTSLGYKVKHVMNITDVDDKTIKGSLNEKIPLKKFTRKYEKIFFDEISSLNIQKPDHVLRATESIKEMVILIKKLLDQEYAYKTSDGIYFSVNKFKDYGKLAQLGDIKKTKKRIKKDEYEKDNIQDFALWKFYVKEDGDVFWETKIGKGRPGWHIECSAMSMKVLGNSFEIHTGGADLIFPHHTNEIAQSESATKKKFVKYWVHGGMLTTKEKMSKSLGNVIYLKDLKKKDYSPLDYRYFCLTKHYRSPLTFTWKNLDSAKNSLKKLKNIVLEMKKSSKKINKKNFELASKQFFEIINDDLNISRAMSYLWEILRENKLNDSEKYKLALEFDKVFGLDLGKEEKIKISSNVKKFAEEREKFRKKKNWKKADELRDKIVKLGYIIEDKEKGYVLKKK